MTFEHFFAEFGDELGADLFWFGIYGTDSFTEKPWELLAEKPWELLGNDEGSKELKDVKVNYDSMMEQEAEKLKKESSEGFVAWISNIIAYCLNLIWYLFPFFKQYILIKVSNLIFQQ